MLSVSIRAFEVEVEIQSSEHFPDHLNDICNRAVQVFQKAIDSMLKSGIALAEVESEE